MDRFVSRPATRSDLLAIIAQVRRRWRLKLALRGAAAAAGILALALVAAAVGLELTRFSPAAIVTLRIATLVVAIVVAALFLARPLMRRVSDEQVALYLEEHEPSLEAAIVSAVEAPQGSAVSPAFLERLVETAIERCQAVDVARRVDQPYLRGYSGALAGVIAAALLVFLLGPAYLRNGASALLRLSQNVEAASPYRIEVRPGSADVPRGSDQTITAKLVGFQSEQVELMVRKAASTSFERVPLIKSNGADASAFETMLFDVAARTEYFVESAGVRSAVFTLNIVDLPYVDRLELEYRFPAYTGMTPQKLDNGGDIVVLKGTEVAMRVHPTMATGGGRVLLHDATVMNLTREADGTLTGTFTADRDGFYRIELDGPKAEKVAASPQYTIDVLNDQPPTVTIAKPQRDTKASPLEEVFVEAQADDDYGIAQLQLVYSVNGAPTKTLNLFNGGRKATKEITAGHTFYLEELGVEAGDFVSYFAVAKDHHETKSSDMYFLQIRPFKKDFKPAMSQAGMQGGGGGGAQVGALSQQQRQIIAGTFNVVRDRKNYTAEKMRENVVLLTLAQSRLREQVDELVGRMNSRLVEPDPAFRKIAEILPKAVAEMREAEKRLQAQAPDKALEPEQRALQHLQKAEEEYELQVTTQRNAGGGGGGAGSIAEDLADLFELELDKLANQYEQTQSASQQSGDQQLDELMEKLKELARRQEQEAERQRRRAAQNQNGQQGGGAAQRALAEQAEEAARRLERLSREQNRPDLREAARRMQEAADAMRRAAATGDPSAAAQASAALERLRDAQRKLEEQAGARGARDLNDAMRKAEEIAREQADIAGDVAEMGQPGGGREKAPQVNQRKDALERKVADLERQLDRTAGDMRKDQRDASRKLSEAANGIRDDKIKEKIRYSKAMVQAGAAEQARSIEESIGSNINDLRRRLADANAAMGKASKTDRMADSLEKARQMARGIDSLDQRMRERSDERDRGRSGQLRDQNRNQRGQQGQDAQQGQQGERGQGQQAQSGQQGSQGGRNQSGRETQGGRDGEGNTVGAPDGGGWGGGSRRPGDYLYNGEDIRQFRGEFREWTAQGQELRRQLREQGVDVTDLDEILRSLKALDDDRVYKDAAELERLQSFVSEGLKRFEYSLRRKVETADQQLFLSGSDEVPAGFRDLVEEYYRSLAKKKPQQ